MNVPVYQISVDLMNFSFRDQICQKKYEWQKVWKNKHWIRYKNIAMYAFADYVNLQNFSFWDQNRVGY